MPAEASTIGPSDTALLEACATQDHAAFRTLYNLWSARLHGIALRITGDRALAADATHDAFVQIWQQSARFDPAKGSPAAWLATIARYRALDLVRRRGRETLGQPPSEETDPGPDPLAALAATADGDALKRCLDELAPDRRTLVLLAFVDGLSHSQLAEKRGMPLGSVKSAIRRALIGLKECLAP